MLQIRREGIKGDIGNVTQMGLMMYIFVPAHILFFNSALITESRAEYEHN